MKQEAITQNNKLMNVYEFRVSGEKEWICANTIIEALQFYYSLNSIDLVEFSETDDIVLVPESEWASMEILDIEAADEDSVNQTFAQYMKTAIEPDIIATTCY